ncbi:MAG: hypothetical protein HC849_08345 [Oscillatoriales cyanobacterium RU_3_3]|nr:hypothetical protein [Oscillatoriales cyanobacterium RU_3_3]NJR23938.1 hypothetical protein [Richelia sp. CSU_2_1]
MAQLSRKLHPASVYLYSLWLNLPNFGCLWEIAASCLQIHRPVQQNQFYKRRQKAEGRRKRQEGRRKEKGRRKEEGRRKRQEGKRKKQGKRKK